MGYGIGFPEKSMHKECSICFDVREMLHHSPLSQARKSEVANQLREHLRGQYHDRLIYWALREASRMHQNVLTTIIDSMDKVKTPYPERSAHRKPACLEGMVRPRGVLSAVLCHGYCTSIYVTEDELSHGASAFCELLCRALDDVKKVCDVKRLPIPQHLVIQSDSTTAQAKHSVAAEFLGY